MDFDAYWLTVVGTMTPAEVCLGFDFQDAKGFDEWLGHAEAEAWIADGKSGPTPDEWEPFHATALAKLEAAAGLSSSS